ncbi:hypothetical protein GJ496_009437 [Pomphorhynchus laevis]|nr:hypothetical protein GJ496_009437 [Pomphorhynchus laevis]
MILVEQQRCKSDREVNHRPTIVLKNRQLVEQSWDTVIVGDIIQLRNNDFVTADIFIVSTSESSGLCYIETTELDGETNLKVKQALDVTAMFRDNLTALSNFKGTIDCDPPNNNLNKFEGNLYYKGELYPLNNDNILLRGCRVRNTRWCFGIVVYAGSDTKLIKNSGKPPYKQTAIDKILNSLIIKIFVFLITICCIAMIGCGVFEGIFGYQFTVYLPWESFITYGQTGGAIVNAVLQFWSYIIVLNTVVPISLYVSIEIIRVFQSKLIDWDINMYDEIEDIHAVARTTTLNEELGRIKYVFSDKTGTLTKNVMTFVQCSINGTVYGSYGDDSVHDYKTFNTNQNSSEGFIAAKAFQWNDIHLVESLRNNNNHVLEFFINLAICHTVMVENENDTENIRYQAQSPDEEALVQACRYFGITFLSRTINSINVMIKGEVVTFKVLNILDFNNERKRMSIIVRHPITNTIKLYCKGADIKICERLCKKSLKVWPITEEHLNVRFFC